MSLVGYSPQDCRQSDTTEVTWHAHTHKACRAEYVRKRQIERMLGAWGQGMGGEGAGEENRTCVGGIRLQTEPRVDLPHNWPHPRSY